MLWHSHSSSQYPPVVAEKWGLQLATQVYRLAVKSSDNGFPINAIAWIGRAPVKISAWIEI